MEGPADSASWRSFRIALSYTDADLTAYQQVIAARQAQSGRRFSTHLSTWGTIGTGFAAGLIGAWLASEAGIVRNHDGGLLAALIFAGFWLGVWSPSIWSGRRAVQLERARRDALRLRWKDAVLFVSPRGIATRLPAARGFYARAAIKTASREKGLVLLWTEPDVAAIAIPVGLLHPAQQDMLLSFGRETSGSTLSS